MAVDNAVLGKGPVNVVTVGLGRAGEIAVSELHERIAEDARLVVVRWPEAGTLREAVAAIAAALDAEKIEKAVWWGSSIGGAMCLLAAATIPYRVAGMIIASSALPVPRVASLVSVSRALIRLLPASFALKKILQRTGLDPDSAAAQVLKASLTKRDLVNWIGWAADYHRLGPAPFARLPASGIPVLIIGCEDDPSVPKAELERLIAFFPDAKAVVFPDGGHFPQLHHRAEFEQSILDFLKPFKR